MRHAIIAAAVFAAVLLTAARVNTPEKVDTAYVLLVSIDGYRHDYTDLFAPPNLMRFRGAGVTARSLIPVFPSKTFSSHFSMVTGLYPEDHGIVGNYIHDPGRPEGDRVFELPNRKAVGDGTWYLGTPVWVSAERAGLLTAPYFWPGAEAAIQGVRATYAPLFERNLSNEKRVAQVLEWLQLPAERRPHFLTLYFNAVDRAAHEHGTKSAELREAVLGVDAALGQLLAGLAKLEFGVNVFVVSDHGMLDVGPEDVEYLDDWTSLDGVVLGELGSQADLFVSDPARVSKILRDLNKGPGKGAGPLRHFRAYRKSELPRRLHYSRSPRIGNIVVLAEPGHLVSVRGESRFKYRPGAHGYDPRASRAMHGIFYAKGPGIRGPAVVDAFENVSVYPCVMKLLGLRPERRSGGADNRESPCASILR